jgi:hypothetical protein
MCLEMKAHRPTIRHRQPGLSELLHYRLELTISRDLVHDTGSELSQHIYLRLIELERCERVIRVY